MEDVFGVGKVVEALVDPVADILKRIAGPAAEEIGLTLRDNVHVYRAKRAYALGQKFLRFCEEQHLEPKRVDLKLLLPILDFSSVEEDEDLHTMWARLLTTAADPTASEVPPSFPRVLHELSAKEAILFQGLAADIRSIRGIPPFDCRQLMYELLPGTNASDLFRMLDTLRTLGLITMNAADTTSYLVGENDLVGVSVLFFGVAVTEYGRQFLIACSPKTMS